ncbi:MAG: GMC family oxidoreductase [Candidatus Dormibacteraeota bacterium]|nr:GMC family oxidoreductase [Candidatus Dormibacteraeota bacterium]
MLIAAGNLPDGTALHCDVAIVGSGPAGLTVAEELADRRCRVVILESGGSSSARRDRRHLVGESSGEPFPIVSSRARGFGGTSRLWNPETGLRVRRLDAIDFDPLAARGASRWPFGACELEPFYQRAEASLGLARGGADVDWPPDDPAGSDGGSKLASFQFTRHSVFLDRLDRLTASPWVELMLGATVRGIEVSRDSGAVTALQVTSHTASNLRIEAKRYVLGCGAIENARLLLESPGLTGGGVGNEHDQVGRWFMDHLCVDTGVIAPSIGAGLGTLTVSELTGPSPSADEGHHMLWVGEAAIRHEDLLNAAFWIFPAPRAYVSPAVQSIRALRMGLKSTPKRLEAPARLGRALRGGPQLAGFALSRLLGSARSGSLVLRALCEQLPDPRSRVTLSERRDASGRRLVDLNWRVSPDDVLQLRRHQEILAERLLQRREGTIIDCLPVDGSPPLFWTNHHHLGGTRIHADPKQGVVDAGGRVHSAPNLFVVGGSVFPTGGYVNPTFTIIALAIRAAELIRRELSGCVPVSKGQLGDDRQVVGGAVRPDLGLEGEEVGGVEDVVDSRKWEPQAQ